MNVEGKIGKYSVSKAATLISALKKMDQSGIKSLLVLGENNSFYSLISIGDIQRAIIKNMALDTNILEALRKNIIIGNVSDSIDKLKERMLNLRIELMPIVDDDNMISDILLWEELFDHNITTDKIDIEIPVVIMAGGLGSRLRPLTNVIPKPLLPIGEHSIIDVIIDKFIKFGLRKFHISTNYKSELIRFHFEQHQKDIDVNIVKESFPLGTAGSLDLLKNELKTTFFLTNCDIIISTDYSEILNYHRDTGNSITIVASVKEINIPYGTIESGLNGELLQLKEKPQLIFMINTGMYIIDPVVFDFIVPDTHLDMTTLIDKVKDAGLKVGVFPTSDKSWTDIGEWAEYLKILDKVKL